MNRHHPYGGGYDGGGRRGGPPGGFGPDRSHRYNDRGGSPSRGRGFGRGRGGGAPYGGGYGGGPAAYDQGPPQGDMGYNGYDAGPPQDNYYTNNSNGSFSGGMPGQYDSPDAASGYDQGYGNYEGALESHAVI